jgi:hypothetical protein
MAEGRCCYGDNSMSVGDKIIAYNFEVRDEVVEGGDWSRWEQGQISIVNKLTGQRASIPSREL